MSDYVHGYNSKESSRLEDQATTLVDILHHDTRYQPGERILEAGCGVGAQTVALTQNSPDSHFTSIDISAESVKEAQKKIDSLGITNVEFQQGDIFKLDFAPESFDHIFICFVLEHLPAPEKAISHLMTFLKPGGTVTVIEGDHGSTFFYPESEYARQAIEAQIVLQRQSGGNANIGRELYPVLSTTELQDITVSPRMVYVDGSRPELIEGFTINTFTAMIEGIRETAVSSNVISAEAFDNGINDLYRTAEPDGVFCYTFFKAVARK